MLQILKTINTVKKQNNPFDIGFRTGQNLVLVLALDELCM